MDLKLPSEYEFTSDTEALISDVEKLAQSVNEFRPLKPYLVENAHKKLFPERVFYSNAIEGNTLTLRETTKILSSGHIIEPRHREGIEARNLGDAIQCLETTLLRADAPNTAESFLFLHAILLKDLDPIAGRFRPDRRMITGAKHQPPRPELVPDLVQRMFDALNANIGLNAVKLATWVHWAIARIHPFTDGNGRMARLWQDLVLLRAQLAPAIIRLQDRDQNGYYDALATADDGDINPLTQLISQRTAATLEQYIAAQQQDSGLADWATNLTGEVSTRDAEQRRAKYLRWARLMEGLRSDFQRCAAKLTASGIEVQFREYPTIDEIAWENIRNGIGARQTWFFSLSFRRNAKSLRYLFFFGKHFWTKADTEEERSEPRVSLLISEQLPDQKEAVRLSEMNVCPISLREIFTLESSLVAVEFISGQDATGGESHLHNADGLKLAQDFIGQVILRRLN